MLVFWLTAFNFIAARQAPPAVCSLAGPSVEANWTGTVPQITTAAAPLQVVADLPLPGSASRFDYQSLESTTGRLFISHTGHSVAVDPATHRVYVPLADVSGRPALRI